MWELLLIIAIIALLGDKETAGKMLAGVGIGVLLVVALIAGVALWINFPLLAKILLAALALLVVALLCRWIYRRFFSPEARVEAGINRLRKRYYAVMEYIARMETGSYDRAWAWPVAKSRMPRLHAEFERYKQGPPELNALGKPMDWQYLIDDAEQRLAALQPPVNQA